MKCDICKTEIESDTIKTVKTGRYGIQLDNNPLIVDKPYFWTKDFRRE